MFQVSRIVRRPIAMFVDQSDRATIESAIDAGASAYIVDGLRRARGDPGNDDRAAAFERMRTELEQTKSAARCKLIEKAKGILMKSRGLDEKRPGLLRQTAMSRAHRRRRAWSAPASC